MVSSLLAAGLATAVFVGVNVGGSSTGVAFGPATGSHAIGERGAAALMTVFALAGGLLVGPQVVETLGTGFVPPEHFPLSASIAALLFIGGTLLMSNLVGVSGSTSQTAVGAVVGMGEALGVLRYDTLGVVAWWFASVTSGFWVSALVGRHLFEDLVAAFEAESPAEEPRLEWVVVGVGCFMAFSTGASNVGDAVAPLVGAGEVPMIPAVLLAGLSIGVGAFVLGPRTMRTVGTEITPLTVGASVVAVLGATIITFLSAIVIPASLAITTQACVMGFGWGRASRDMPVSRVPGLHREDLADRHALADEHLGLYSVSTTRRIVSMWLLTPTLAGGLAYATFWGAARLGLLGF
jgi:PiT family inorganic phosphate transporter